MDSQDFYKPSGGAAVAEAPPTAQPSSSGTATKPPSNSNFTWTASEYIEHNRGTSWYLLLALATAILATAIYFITKEYFATGAIIISGVIVAVYARQKPRQVTYELSDSGLRVGEKMYAYELFKSFSISKDNMLNNLQLSPLKRFMPPISAYYDAADEEKITDILSQHLPYEDAKTDHIDRLSHRLKF